MNTGELLHILKQARGLGLVTLGDLAQLFQKLGATNNRDKLNQLNAFSCRGYIIRGKIKK